MAKIYKRKKVWYSDIFIGGERFRKPLSTDRRIDEEKLAELIKQRNSLRYGHAIKDINWKNFRK